MKTGNAISNISHAIFGMFDHLYIELSDRCNLRCKHCYLDAGAREENTLDSEVVKSALADFAALGGQTAAFSGGEPLLYPEFDSILDYSRELPLRVTIVTNGTLLTREKIAGLLEKGATLALSIEGYREETHDLIRGSGNFLLVRRVLDILKIMKAQDRTIICVTPSKPNIDELTGLVNMLVNEGFHHFYLSLLEERGRENRHAEKLSLTVEEKVRLLVQVMFLLNNHSGEIHLDAGHLAFFFQRLLNAAARDGLGETVEGTLRLSAGGDLFLSAYADGKRFLLGNLYREKLSCCCSSYRFNDLCTALENRAPLMTFCRDCPYWIICGGGSPARAYTKYKSIIAPDDYCKAKYIFLEKWFEALN